VHGPHEQTLSGAELLELFAETFDKTLCMELNVAMRDRRFISHRDRADLSEGHFRIPKHLKHLGADRAGLNCRTTHNRHPVLSTG
jgi:hypothetical protein